jgi:4-hydroxysphinganine ceramide fatty acyl 2-hydroxylase
MCTQSVSTVSSAHSFYVCKAYRVDAKSARPLRRRRGGRGCSTKNDVTLQLVINESPRPYSSHAAVRLIFWSYTFFVVAVRSGMPPNGESSSTHSEPKVQGYLNAVTEVIDVEEVEKHNSMKNGAWVIHDGSVYDVTSFLRENAHPGGIDVVSEYLGGDITEVFSDGDHSHSKSALQTLSQYRIGWTSEGFQAKISGNHNVDRDREDANKKFGIDMTQPLVMQMPKLGNEYMRYVHNPQHSWPGKAGSARMFASPFLEFFSRTPWWIVPTVWIPEVYAEVAFARSTYELSLSFTLGLMIFGFLIWTFLEYVLHRFLFHIAESMVRGKVLIVMHYLLHGVHHHMPTDKARLVFPPVLTLILKAFIFACYIGIFTLAGLGDAVVPTSICVIAGSTLGYVCYDVSHYMYDGLFLAFNVACLISLQVSLYGSQGGLFPTHEELPHQPPLQECAAWWALPLPLAILCVICLM